MIDRSSSRLIYLQRGDVQSLSGIHVPFALELLSGAASVDYVGHEGFQVIHTVLSQQAQLKVVCPARTVDGISCRGIADALILLLTFDPDAHADPEVRPHQLAHLQHLARNVSANEHHLSRRWWRRRGI